MTKKIVETEGSCKDLKNISDTVFLERNSKMQKYSLQDLKNLQFESKEKRLSKNIDI